MSVALAAGYADDHGAETACPERQLWLSVLTQTATDLVHGNPRVRADSISFFESDNLLLVMDLAGIDRDLAPVLRARAKELAEAPPELCRPNTRRITHQKQTRSLTGWAEVTGVPIHALGYRLRAGWSVEKALTVPMQKASGHSRKVKRSIPTPTGPTISALATSANAEVNAEVKQSGKPVVDQREIQWKIARTEAGGQRYS